MNCLENENVCSVKKENNLGYYRLHTIWRDDGFFINIASKDGAWRGEMTPNDVKKMSSQLELDPKAYLHQCKTALTSHDGQQGMTYAVESGTFTWKKIVDEDSGIKIKLGSIMLKPSSFVDTIQNLVTVALDCNKKLEKELREVKKEKEKMEINRNELSEKLDSLILSKNLMENDLYSKFLALLNSKKSKIAELSNQLGDKNKGDSECVNAYEMDTDNDDNETSDSEVGKRKSERLKKMNKSRRSPLLGESSREKKEGKVEDETLSDDSMSGSCSGAKSSSVVGSVIAEDKNKENSSQMPSTNDELLDFFYN